MEDIVQESGVMDSVAGDQVVTETAETVQTSPEHTSVETAEVDAQPAGEKDNFGPIISKEVARREAKIKEQYESYQRNLERAARFYGFEDTNAYVQALEAAEQERRVQEEAERLGVPEEVVLQHLDPLRKQVDELQQVKTEYEQQKQQLALQQELTGLRAKYNDFDQYGEKIVDIVTNKGYSLEDAYILASHQEKMARMEKDIEARTVKNLQENAASSPGALGQGDVAHETGFSALPREAQLRMIEEVKRGERRSF